MVDLVGTQLMSLPFAQEIHPNYVSQKQLGCVSHLTISNLSNLSIKEDYGRSRELLELEVIRLKRFHVPIFFGPGVKRGMRIPWL